MSQLPVQIATSTSSTIQVTGEDHSAPPLAPPGYVLFVGQDLKESAWLPGNKAPYYHMIATSQFVRLEDLVNPPVSSAELFKRAPEDDTPLEITVHQAMVRQYVYTGDVEEDLQALRMYLDRFDRAITALEDITSTDREKGTERSFFRQQISVARASLLEELDTFRKEVNTPSEPEYYGFDSYDLGLPPLARLTRVRSRGYKWICHI